MPFEPIEVEKRLQRIERNAGVENAVSNAVRSFEQNVVSKTSKLGTRLLGVVAGFQALTQQADDVVEAVQGSRPEQLIAALAITQLTKNVPGLKNKLVLKVGNNRTDLEALTGTSVQDGFLQTRITSSDPEAIAYQTKRATGASSGQIRNVLGEMQNLEDKTFELFETSFNELINPIVGAVTNVLASFNNFRANMLGQLSKTVIGINDAINKGFGSIVENISEQLTGNGRSIVGSLTIKDGIRIELPESDMAFVLNLTSAKTQTQINQAVAFLEKYSDLPRGVIRERLSGIDNRISSNVLTESGELLTSTQIDTGEKTWDYENTPSSHNFSYVSSIEELEVDLKSINREVTEIIVHWTEHFNNQDVGSEEIQTLLSRNGSSIPYHYLIRRDGSIQRGRPVSYQGGALNNNHERYSIQIAFVGGINAPTGTSDYKRFLSANSFTPKQVTSFQQFCAIAYSAWPGAQIMGHNDIDRSQIDPGFDVINEMEHLFGKKNVYENPSEQQPYTRKQLIKVKI
jgi:hypothetical protein